MSGLAKYLLSMGKKVAGYDSSQNEYTRELESLGAVVCTGQNDDSLKDYNLVVYTDAIKDTDKRLCLAQNLGKVIISR